MTIKIYGTTHCSKCQMTKQLLDTKKVPFEFVNLDEHPELIEEVTAHVWPSTSLPIIQVDDKYTCVNNVQEVLDIIKAEE